MSGKKINNDFMVRVAQDIMPSGNENAANHTGAVKIITCFNTFSKNSSAALTEAVAHVRANPDFLLQAHPIKNRIINHCCDAPVMAVCTALRMGEASVETSAENAVTQVQKHSASCSSPPPPLLKLIKTIGHLKKTTLSLLG